MQKAEKSKLRIAKLGCKRAHFGVPFAPQLNSAYSK
jgi:hypothetical protein